MQTFHRGYYGHQDHASRSLTQARSLITITISFLRGPSSISQITVGGYHCAIKKLLNLDWNLAGDILPEKRLPCHEIGPCHNCQEWSNTGFSSVINRFFRVQHHFTARMKGALSRNPASHFTKAQDAHQISPEFSLKSEKTSKPGTLSAVDERYVHISSLIIHYFQ